VDRGRLDERDRLDVQRKGAKAQRREERRAWTEGGSTSKALQLNRRDRRDRRDPDRIRWDLSAISAISAV